MRKHTNAKDATSIDVKSAYIDYFWSNMLIFLVAIIFIKNGNILVENGYIFG